MSMLMGYYYESPKRGNGYNLHLISVKMPVFIAEMTKKSATEVKRMMVLEGHNPEHITIEKNEN